MSQINKIQFGAPLMSCNPTLLSDENKNPETSRLAVLENKVTLLNNKCDECLNLLQKINIKMDTLLCQDIKKIHFPIKTQIDLQKVEEHIGENFESFLPIMEKILLPQGLKKNLSKIISEEVAMEFNYDGIKGKSAFKSFLNLNKLMYEVIKCEGYNGKEYASEMKKAFHLIKARQFKKTYLDRKNNKL